VVVKLSRFHGELHGAKTAVMTSCIHTRRPVNTAITTFLHQSLARRLYRPFSWSMRQVSRGHTRVIGGFVRCLRGFRRLLWSREFSWLGTGNALGFRRRAPYLLMSPTAKIRHMQIFFRLAPGCSSRYWAAKAPPKSQSKAATDTGSSRNATTPFCEVAKFQRNNISTKKTQRPIYSQNHWQSVHKSRRPPVVGTPNATNEGIIMPTRSKMFRTLIL
jgi:hypothetical protein